MVETQVETRWHSLSEQEVLRRLNTSLKGLSQKEAEKRLNEYGYNELAEKKGRTALQMLISQFKDIFILLLIFAAAFSIAVGYFEGLHDPSTGFLESYTDAITIISIVVMCVIAGFVQEFRAEKALEALKRLAAPKARVIREGKVTVIPAKEVVPGDILVLEAGDRVPSDARIIEAIELRANEAILTGESTPVDKQVTAVEPSASVSERTNMVFSATHIVYGRGKAVVVATGMNTEFGKIAKMVQEAEEEKTPLERKLDSFASKIAKIVIAVCIVIFALEFFEVIAQASFDLNGFIQAFMSSIALAISAVPEGLPAIVTITLALGARELAKRNAIIRKLAAAETLGAVTVICSDKTGTLTKGEMTVRKIYVDNKIYEVTGVGYAPKGEFLLRGEKIEAQKDEALTYLLKIGALCNNALIVKEKDKWEVIGDPTEAALIVAAEKAGLRYKTMEKEYPRRGEIPFTSERKCMTTIHLTPEKERIALLKGAPEVVLEKCTYILDGGKMKKLTEKKRKEILKINEEMAKEALRILGMAYRKLPKKTEKYDEKIEREMIFIGLEGMIDPPREEAIEANKKCQKAGIKTVMITGDHKLTALAIAKEIGIYKEGDLVLTGEELEKIDEKEFEKIVEKVTVYARVSPEHKLKIVKALKAKGHIVAMTGDGVNDAPAVKTADIGVAMGITGTDVTKEASHLVLTDDNFATIVRAVEHGRAIYDNIRKYVRYLIACNFTELIVIGTFALLSGVYSLLGGKEDLFPLPLLPSMILWINLVTDGPPAISLATDPPEEDIMERPPRKPEEGMLHGMIAFIIASSILQTTGTFLVFSLKYYVAGAPLEEARTVAFIQAALYELFVVWNCRSEKRSVWRMGRKNFSNKFFVIAIFASIALTLGICYIPVTQKMFHIAPLSPIDLAIVIGVASWGLFVFPELFMNRKIPKWK